jgi:hypothetical protein
MCPNVYCEDCLPQDHQFIGVCDRFADLGYKLPGNACYIHCSAACERFAAEQNSDVTETAIQHESTGSGMWAPKSGSSKKHKSKK